MAREAKGWTRRQLAVTAEVTPAAVSQYENGTYQPTRGVIARIAIALGMPREFFVPGRPTAAASSSVVHFRSLRSTPVRDRRRALTHAVFAWELTNLLESYLSIPPVAFPRAVLSERASRDDMENLAGECRRLLNLGSAPIGNMTRHLESLGAVVVRLPVGCEKVDAFSCVLEDRPIVVLNSDKGDKARSRHDAAHEFGHLVAHDDTEPGSQIVEQQAHAFASAFLLPADQVAPYLASPLDWNMLFRLKRHWGVSLQSLIVRAKHLGTISEHSYRRAFIRLSTAKNADGTTWRKNEPGTPRPPRTAHPPPPMRRTSRKPRDPSRRPRQHALPPTYPDRPARRRARTRRASQALPPPSQPHHCCLPILPINPEATNSAGTPPLRGRASGHLVQPGHIQIQAVCVYDSAGSVRTGGLKASRAGDGPQGSEHRDFPSAPT